MPAVQPRAEPTDTDVIRSVLGGARAEFALLVKRHNQRLFRAVRAIARSDQDAEDVLQQTWLRIFSNLAQFRGDAAFTTWATRIAIHEAIAFARKRPVVAEVREEPTGRDAPDDAVERVQLGQLLERCLQGIPQGSREVMVLRDVLELDTAETAICLNLSEEAVRVRLHRARAAVAAAVTEQMADEVRDVYLFLGARCDRITARVMAEILGAAHDGHPGASWDR
jgi:RNA polymerase sigma-70 factor (ECF subfamily)